MGALIGATEPRAQRIIAKVKKLLLKMRLGERWHSGTGGFHQRVYPSYDSYVSHQRTKFNHLRKTWLQEHEQRFHVALRERLRAVPVTLAGRSVLCLGARQGTEVRAFIEQGAFAVGIDLNPGRRNRYVLIGDFHDLQFANGSVDVVYTNALDHAFDLDRILTEVRRVLADDGLLFVEVQLGSAQGGRPGFYESLSWSSVDDLLERIQQDGFSVQDRSDFEEPWRGEQLILRKRAGDL